MIEDILKSANLARELRSGPAADHVDQYVQWLLAQGYQQGTLIFYLHALARYIRWMIPQGHVVDADASTVFDRYLRNLAAHGALRRAKCKTAGHLRGDVSAARLFTRFLVDIGVATPGPTKTTVADRYPILAEFAAWSSQHRGLKATSLRGYLTVLGRLVVALGEDPTAYTASALRGFALQEGARLGVGGATRIGVATRAFIRFLVATGRAPVGLEHAIPQSASWSLSSLPRYIESDDVQRVISACPDTPLGVRDRAMILLLARLGLRASDVAELCLGDIDWAGGRFAVSGKGRRAEWLPLPQDVGDAILHYLREARPKRAGDAVFLNLRAPHGPMTLGTVSCACRRAFLRAGVDAPTKGAQVLRHSAATAMLRQGASLAGVGAVLRHRWPDTTALYAKVDLPMLETLAQPWPGVAPC